MQLYINNLFILIILSLCYSYFINMVFIYRYIILKQKNVYFPGAYLPCFLLFINFLSRQWHQSSPGKLMHMYTCDMKTEACQIFGKRFLVRDNHVFILTSPLRHSSSPNDKHLPTIWHSFVVVCPYACMVKCGE